MGEPSGSLSTGTPAQSKEKTEEKVDRQVLFEDVLEKCGGVGWWHWVMLLYLSIAWLGMPTMSLGMVFVGATPEFRCADGFPENATFASLPADTPRCHPLNSTAACTRWAFDTSVFRSTVVTEWLLVCDRKPLLSILQSLLMLGAMVGSWVGGKLSDRFGRRNVVRWGILLMCPCGVIITLVPNYASFAALRFIIGVGLSFVDSSQFTLVSEFFSGKERATACNAVFLAWPFGICLTSGLSYAFRDHKTLQFFYAGALGLMLPYLVYMPESPRWLVVNGRFTEAYEFFRRAARWNRRPIPEKDEVIRMMEDVQSGIFAREAAIREGTSESLLQRMLQLVRTPRMRQNVLICSFSYFIFSGSAFGMTFDSAQLTDSPHLAVCLMGLIELPTELGFLMTDRIGRYPTVLSWIFTGAIAMLLVPVKRDHTFWLVLGLIAKLSVSTGWNATNAYFVELVPTQLRGEAYGVFAVGNRLGGAVSPFVVDLVSELDETAPSVVFGVALLLACLAVFFLPETLDRPMPETVADVENQQERGSCLTCCQTRSNRISSSPS